MKGQEIQNRFRTTPKSEDGSKILISIEKISFPKTSLKSAAEFFRNRMVETKKFLMHEYLFSGSFFTGITKCKHQRNIDQ